MVDLICIGCNKKPEEIQEYIDMGKEENMTPSKYVWEKEGTLNRSNGHFTCTSCYIKIGMPSSSRGWVAP